MCLIFYLDYIFIAFPTQFHVLAFDFNQSIQIQIQASCDHLGE